MCMLEKERKAQADVVWEDIRGRRQSNGWLGDEQVQQFQQAERKGDLQLTFTFVQSRFERASRFYAFSPIRIT